MKRTMLLATALAYAVPAFAVLNGEIVDFRDYPHTVIVQSGDTTSSGVLVGPRVVLSGPYGVQDRASVEVDGRVYPVTKVDRKSDPSNQGLSVLLLAEEIAGGRPLSVAGQVPLANATLEMFGYGATKPEMSAAWTKFLSRGIVNGFSWNEGGAIKIIGTVTANFGDSGGPVVIGQQVLGLLTAGNLVNNAYATNLLSYRGYLANYAVANGVEICGINAQCP